MKQVNRTKRTWMNIPVLKMKDGENKRNRVGIPDRGEIDGDGKDVGGDQPSGKSIKTKCIAVYAY